MQAGQRAQDEREAKVRAKAEQKQREAEIRAEEQAQANRGLRRLVGVLIVVFVLALLAAGFALNPDDPSNWTLKTDCFCCSNEANLISDERSLV